MAIRKYQTDIALNTLHEVRLKSASGLGEAINPRLTSIGGTVSVYGSENAPDGLTLANIGTKMALLGSGISMKFLYSIPNYICIVQDSGASTELVLTGVALEDAGTLIS